MHPWKIELPISSQKQIFISATNSNSTTAHQQHSATISASPYISALPTETNTPETPTPHGFSALRRVLVWPPADVQTPEIRCQGFRPRDTHALRPGWCKNTAVKVGSSQVLNIHHIYTYTPTRCKSLLLESFRVETCMLLFQPVFYCIAFWGSNLTSGVLVKAMKKVCIITHPPFGCRASQNQLSFATAQDAWKKQRHGAGTSSAFHPKKNPEHLWTTLPPVLKSCTLFSGRFEQRG